MDAVFETLPAYGESLLPAAAEAYVERELQHAASELRLIIGQYPDHGALQRRVRRVREALDAVADELCVRRPRP
jgi:hypothetical protein